MDSAACKKGRPCSSTRLKGQKAGRPRTLSQSNVTTEHAGYPKGLRASLLILVLQLPDRAFVPKLAPDSIGSFGAI